MIALIRGWEVRWPGLAGIGVLSGARALSAVFSALAVTIVAHRLGPAELGSLSLALAAQGYALHLSEWGMRTVVTAESAVRGGPRAALRCYLLARLPLAAGVYAIGMVTALCLFPASAGTLAIVLASIVAIALHLDWVPLADGRSGVAASLVALRPAVYLTGLIVLPGIATVTMVAVWYLAAWWMAAGASWLACRHSSPPEPSPTSEQPLRPRELLRRGTGSLGVTLLNQAQLSLDLIVVGWCYGEASAGQYFLATALAGGMLVVANAMGQSSLARMARHKRQPAEFRRLLMADLRLAAVFGVALAVLVAVAGPPLLSVAFGTGFAPAATALVALAPWIALQHVTSVLQGGLTARRAQGLLVRANLVMVAVMGPLLVLAVWSGNLAVLALVRTGCELARLTVIIAASRRHA